MTKLLPTVYQIITNVVPNWYQLSAKLLPTYCLASYNQLSTQLLPTYCHMRGICVHVSYAVCSYAAHMRDMKRRGKYVKAKHAMFSNE